MSRLDRLRRAFRLPPSTDRVRGDVDAELRFHIEGRIEELVARGVSPDAAKAEVSRRFGDLDRIGAEMLAIDERYRHERMRSERLHSLLQDLRYAARGFMKRPAFSAVVLVTLALGIGANTAIFSVVNAVLLRPLPYRDPERIVHLWETRSAAPAERNPVSVPNFRDWASESRSYSAIGAYAYNKYNLSLTGEPEQVQGAQFLGGVFDVLGVRPLLGRALRPVEEREHFVVLSERLWRRRFGADPAVIGRAIRMSDTPHTIVGVMPASFRFPRPDVELWTSYASILAEGPAAFGRGRRFQRVVARLAPGVTIERAEQEMNVIARRLAAMHPETNEGSGVAVVSLHEQTVGDVRPTLITLLGAVGFVLLIACANVANLFLARTAARERELAVRMALGAGRGRLLQQLLTESLLYALAGGAAGWALAWWGVRALISLSPGDIPRLESVGVDAVLLLFALAVSVISGVCVGLLPALRGSKLDLSASVKEGSRGAGQGARGRRAQGALVVSELAVSLVLLVGAGLMAQSLQRLLRVDFGFESNGVTTMLAAGSFAKYREPAQQVALFRRIEERVALLPGVEHVGFCDCLPPQGSRTIGSFFVEGRAHRGEAPMSDQVRVGAEFFETLRVPLLKGRLFTDADRDGAPPVAIINAVLARRFFSDQDPIGKRLSLDEQRWMTVVGVVGDLRHWAPTEEILPAIYYPLAQDPFIGMYMFVRTSGEPSGVLASIRREVSAVDAELPLADVQLLDERVAQVASRSRFSASLLTAFAVLAVILATVGIYGVMSYAVAQRTHEIGVRMALGAARGEVARMILGQSAKLCAMGLTLGLIMAWAATRLMSTQLYAISATDVATYTGVSLLLAAIVLGATYVPARRAMKVDPIQALRFW